MKFDELSVGQVFTTKSLKVSKEDITKFASEFDPQYMHLDEKKAKEGIKKRLPLLIAERPSSFFHPLPMQKNPSQNSKHTQITAAAAAAANSMFARTKLLTRQQQHSFMP